MLGVDVVLLNCKIIRYICKEALEFAEISNCKKEFWIDSQTMLTRRKTSPRLFVLVRVAEIQ